MAIKQIIKDSCKLQSKDLPILMRERQTDDVILFFDDTAGIYVKSNNESKVGDVKVGLYDFKEASIYERYEGEIILKNK